MSDRDAFLTAIRAAPDDDAPRLVYADWLDEHGQSELAEFIRVQIEIEAYREPDTDLDCWRRATIDRHLDRPVPEAFPADLHRYAELARRERDLKAGQWAWLAPLGGVDEDGGANLSVTFHRGLADQVAMATHAFVESGDAVRAACPDLRRLTLYGPRGQVPELVASPALAGIPELELAGWISEHDVRFLAVWLACNPVRSLTIWVGNAADVEVNRILVRRALGSRPRAGPAPSRRLTTPTYLGDLRELVLVQLHGGLRVQDSETGLGHRAQLLAAMFNVAVGRQVARVEQPYARRFPLAGDVGHGLFAGRLPDGPALVCDGLRPYLVRFDTDGQFTEERSLDLKRPVPRRGASAQANLGPEVLLRSLREANGFAPGPIFVREFAADQSGVSVYLWGTFDDVVADPDAGPDGDAHEEACAALHRDWMKGGNFVIHSGTDYWAGPDGAIHSS